MYEHSCKVQKVSIKKVSKAIALKSILTGDQEKQVKPVTSLCLTEL
jgi:hypothetical protein